MWWEVPHGTARPAICWPASLLAWFWASRQKTQQFGSTTISNAQCGGVTMQQQHPPCPPCFLQIGAQGVQAGLWEGRIQGVTLVVNMSTTEAQYPPDIITPDVRYDLASQELYDSWTLTGIQSAPPSIDGDEDRWSETTTLSSSVLNYVYENGRRYASYGKGNYVCACCFDIAVDSQEID